MTWLISGLLVFVPVFFDDYQAFLIYEFMNSPYYNVIPAIKELKKKKKVRRELCIIIKEEQLYRKAFHSASCPFVTTKDDLIGSLLSFFLRYYRERRYSHFQKSLC